LVGSYEVSLDLSMRLFYLKEKVFLDQSSSIFLSNDNCQRESRYCELVAKGDILSVLMNNST
jgi:hypothetical protein